MSLLIAAGLLIACLVLAILPRRDVPGRGLAVLRCFFPSWRFFEQIELGPSLEICVAGPHEDGFGPWREAWTATPRTAARLFVNARGNLELAFQSLVEQLWSELGDSSDPTSSITYQLVRQLVEVECLRSVERGPGCRYRFRIATEFVSAEHSVGAA